MLLNDVFIKSMYASYTYVVHSSVYVSFAFVHSNQCLLLKYGPKTTQFVTCEQEYSQLDKQLS